MKAVILILLAVCCSGISIAQDITGIWAGTMGSEVLFLHLKQKGNDVCGKSHDQVNNDNYCKQRITGTYSGGKYHLRGEEFLKREGDHILLNLKLDTPVFINNEWQLNGSFNDGSEEIPVRLKKNQNLSAAATNQPSCFTPVYD